MKKASTIQQKADLNAALISAIKSSETESVAGLLEQGADPNTMTVVDLWGYGARSISALMLAMTWFRRRENSTERFNEPLVRALIEAGVNLQSTSQYEETPLYEAVDSGRHDLVEFMLDHGADVNANFASRYPLCQACYNGDREMVLLLLNRGAIVSPEKVYRSPLMCAVEAKQKDIVVLLLSHRADVHYRSKDGATALSLIKGKRGVAAEIREMLEAAGAKPDLLEQECRQLIRAVEDSEILDVKIVERWTELCRENEKGSKFNRTHLHHALLLCRLGSLIAMDQQDYSAALEIVERLLQHPKAKQLAFPESLEIYGDKLYLLLLTDNEAQGIAFARELMMSNVNIHGVEFYYARHEVAEALVDYFETIATQNSPVSKELTELAWDVSQQLRRNPLKSRRLPEQAAPQELHKLLLRRG